MKRLHWTALACVMASGVAIATPVEIAVCGTGENATICFASVDQSGRLTPVQRARLGEVGTRAVDIISSPEFERELTAFHAAHANTGEHARYWRDFNPRAAVADARSSFDGLHIETIGGLRAWFSANVMDNVAYEGSTRPDGSRDILLNRFRLNRPLSALIGTYVHEASHKAGYSHRAKQDENQKCEPPYVMGQIAQKLADPDGWADYIQTSDACRFWRA